MLRSRLRVSVGKDIVYKLINFTSDLRNHEEFKSFASNQISRLSDMSNLMQVEIL
jgi:hypothetical protein